jgi:hypothetical protein
MTETLIDCINFTLEVRYGPSLEAMIADFPFHFVHSGIRSDRFLVARPRCSQSLIMRLLRLVNAKPDPKDALAKMRHQGFCPATVQQLLALARQWSTFPTVGTVVCLGSSWRGADRILRFPALDKPAHRHLCLNLISLQNLLINRTGVWFASVPFSGQQYR